MLSGMYHLKENVAFEIAGGVFGWWDVGGPRLGGRDSELTVELREKESLAPERVKLYQFPWVASADAQWSPFYGKVSFLNSILHLDAYVLGGGGVVYTETSGAHNEDGSPDLARTGVKPAFDLGVGLRFVAKDFLAVNVALINTTYADVPTGSTKAVTQNLMMLQAGVSIFFPFKSTFREAE